MKLRPASSHLYEAYSGIRVHIDELEYIAQLMESAGLSVVYSDDSYDYDSLDELVAKRGVHPSNICLSAKNPLNGFTRISVSFSRSGATIHALYPEEVGELRYQLCEFLQSQRSWIARLFNYNVWAPLLILAVFLSASGWQAQRYGEDVSLMILYLLTTLVLFSLAIRYGFTGVWLKRRHEGGFFARNADKLWLLLIGAIIGVAIDWIAEFVKR